MPPIPPAPHFPSPYARPSTIPRLARRICRPDGAQIAFFVYDKGAENEDTQADVDKGNGGRAYEGVRRDAIEGAQAETNTDAAVPFSGSGAVNARSGDGLLAACAATPVLFLHGNGEEHGIFGPQIDAVVDAGGVAVGIDSRAQGKSTRGTARLTYDLMAEDALAVLDELHMTRAHVVGFSDGAIEALLLARDHPDRVASAVVIGANLTPGGVDNTDFPMAEIADQNEAWAQWLENQSTAKDLKREETTVSGAATQHEAHPAEPTPIDPTLLSPSATEAQNTADLMRLMMEEPHIAPASLSAISCPVAVVAGEFDVIREPETFTIKRSIPTAELYLIPDCGHSLPKHAPEAITEVLFHTIHRVQATNPTPPN